VWGDPNVKEDVLVNGTALLVTKSLASALRQVRASGATEIMNAFWADGLSINQSDNAEKGHQVRLMSEIYKRATLILSWLGAAPEDGSLCFSAVRKAADAVNKAL